MRIDIMTLFPDMCRAVLDESIVGRARKAGKVEIRTRNMTATKRFASGRGMCPTI